MRLRPQGKRSKAAPADGSSLNALARSGGDRTTLGSASTTILISMRSPSPMPLAARFAALIPTRHLPRINAIRVRHVWPLTVTAIKGRGPDPRAVTKPGGISTAVALPDGITFDLNFTDESPSNSERPHQSRLPALSQRCACRANAATAGRGNSRLTCRAEHCPAQRSANIELTRSRAPRRIFVASAVSRRRPGSSCRLMRRLFRETTARRRLRRGRRRRARWLRRESSGSNSTSGTTGNSDRRSASGASLLARNQHRSGTGQGPRSRARIDVRELLRRR